MQALWEIINIPFGFVMRFCTKIMGNQYLLALLIFAIILEIVLLPFSIKQQKNSIKQAKLRPKEMAIRKKYAGRDDQPTKQKMTQEIQELYQKEGYNPMSGCLPLLIQFPLLIALYNIVIRPLHYICQLETTTIQNLVPVVNAYGYNFDVTAVASRDIELMGALKDILKSDPSAFNMVEGFNAAEVAEVLPNLKVGFLDFSLVIFPDHWKDIFTNFTAYGWLILVPVLTFVVYFFSTRLTRKLSYQPISDNDNGMGCSTKMMDIVMPLFSVYIACIVPAVVGVYWIFKSILGVLKQFLLKKFMPTPVFTEEDYRAAEKELNVRADNKAPKVKSGKVVRSLHHIDDEDFADTAEKAKAHKEALKAQEEAAAAEQKPQTLGDLFAGIKMKKEENPEKKEKKEKKSKKTKDEADTQNSTDTTEEK